MRIGRSHISSASARRSRWRACARSQLLQPRPGGASWPAHFPWVTAVGALNGDKSGRAPFSNYGTGLMSTPPGTDLVNAFATGTYQGHELSHVGEERRFTGMARWSGTS